MGFIGDEEKHESPSVLRSPRMLVSRQTTAQRGVAVTAAVVAVIMIIKYLDIAGIGGTPVEAFYRHRTAHGINPSEWKLFSELISRLDAACESTDLRYLLFEGSLVGLYHNSGPLPWDDDVDVVMMEEDALKLIEMVESKKLGDHVRIGTCCSKSQNVLKLHSVAPGSRPVPGQPFTWPFVDIMVAREDKISGDLRVRDKRHPRSLFQQRSRALFGGISIWAPSDIAGALVAEYGPAVLTTCTTSTFDHRRWKSRAEDQPTSIECERLAEVGYLRRRGDKGRQRRP